MLLYFIVLLYLKNVFSFTSLHFVKSSKTPLFSVNKNILTPKLFNEWLCIGIIEKIDFTKPYDINIGELPLIVWKYNNKYYSTINICKHMGSKLNNAEITSSGCLKCQYHGFEYTKDSDIFGLTIEYQGKIFWSYNPTKKLPEKVPHYFDNKYTFSFLQIDMESSLIDSVYNSMDLRHPQYVHNGDKNGFGFGSDIKPQNIKHYNYSKTRIGLSFDYSSSRALKKINNNIITNNFHMFIYPSFSWSRVSFNNNNLIVAVNMLPLSEKKTRWFITLCHNYYLNPIEKSAMKIMAFGILIQDYNQMKNQYDENALKKEILFEQIFDDEEVILYLREMMKDYQYPDINICANLYKNYKNK
jgi:hypothetical protein